MTLDSGAKLGVYEIGALLGRGGMGEVYLARDSRLKRSIAIKILPPEFSQDQDRLRRFQLEAEALAALDHSNIAAIHALEQFNETRFLVLEFVEGETLAERLQRGPMALDDVISIGAQICRGLSGAHEKGIVHRDLKPANIKITPDEKVKLLDFGLVRMLASDSAAGDLSNSPTMISGSVGPALIGTAAYMSPEQARGKPVDKRADIWALGCILYEMLTGQPLFSGETVTDILAAVVTREPDLQKLPANAPFQIRLLLTKCLQKDPNLRFRDASDAAALLTGIESVPTVTPAKPRRFPRMAWAVPAVIVLAALISTAVVVFRPSPSPARPMRFEIPVVGAPVNQALALSPDGRQIVYVADAGEGGIALWLRSLDTLDSRMLPGTESRRTLMLPFWSPDNRSIAFAADGKLKKVDVAGGPAETLDTLDTQFGGGAWSRDGTILFASNEHGLRRVSASGGDVTVVTELDPSLGEIFHDNPSFLPDGRHFLYLAFSSKPGNGKIYVGSLDSKIRTPLMNSDTVAMYTSSGFVLFTRDQTLMARPFDAGRLEFTGEAIPIAKDIAHFAGGEVGIFAASDEGTLVYRTAPAQTAGRQLSWVDRSGKTTEPIGPPISQTLVQLKLSPDGKRALFTESDDSGVDDVWVYDLDRKVKTRLTTNPAVDHNPIWSPDGTQILFDSHRANDAGAIGVIYEQQSSGATPEHVFLTPEKGVALIPRDWSLMGDLIVLGRSPTGSTPWDIWLVRLSDDLKPVPYIASPANEGILSLSPSGRWLAYTSNESGRSQVIVQAVPDPSAGKWQISTDGGAYPRWRRDGRELFYLTPAGVLTAVSVSGDTKFEIGKSTVLFQTPLAFTGEPGGFPYDVTADGQRFLISAPVGTANTAPITTVVHWPAPLK